GENKKKRRPLLLRRRPWQIAWVAIRLAHLLQQRNPSSDDPFSQVDIAVSIEGCPMRMDELTGDPLIALLTHLATVGVDMRTPLWVVVEVSEDVVFFIEQGQTRVEFPYQHHFPP